VEVREQLSSALQSLDNALVGIHEEFGEMTILSTCNRVEFYAYVREEHAPDACGTLLNHIAHFQGRDRDALETHLYKYEGREVVEHLCRVAAGLDSLVLGEPQIMGQVHEAIEHASEQQLAGEKLNALFQTALRTGKRARSDTGISRNPVSISSMAVYKGKRALGSLQGKNAVVIGVGEMGRLALKSLKTRGLASLTIVNRNPEKARIIAQDTGARVRPLSDLPNVLAKADLVISATGSPEPIIDKAMVRTALNLRSESPLAIIDIAMPRDITPDVTDLQGVNYFDIDALKTEVDASLKERQKEIPQVERIIVEEVDRYSAWLRKATVKPVISSLRRKAEAIRTRELDRVLGLLSIDLDKKDRETLSRFSTALVKKILHDPTMRLRDEALNGQSGMYADMVRYLFDLEEDGRP